MSSSETEKGLKDLLDFLIPPNPAKNRPGGSEVGFRPDALAEECLKVLDDAAAEKYSKRFYALRSEEKASLSASLTRVQKTQLTRLAKNLAEDYYVSERPPFPDGFHVEEGDWMLLEPVYERGKIFRDVN